MHPESVDNRYRDVLEGCRCLEAGYAENLLTGDESTMFVCVVQRPPLGSLPLLVLNASAPVLSHPSVLRFFRSDFLQLGT